MLRSYGIACSLLGASIGSTMYDDNLLSPLSIFVRQLQKLHRSLGKPPGAKQLAITSAD